MSTPDRTCPSCGAHVPDEADRCDLCGTPVAASDDAPTEPTEEPSDQDGGQSKTPDAQPSGSDEQGEAPPVFCNQCGWENPPGAQYCSRCGEELQDLSDAAPPGTRRVRADLPSGEESGAEESASSPASEVSPEDDEGGEQAVLGRQIAFVVGGALVLVVGLFFVTQWSAQYEWSDTPSSPSAPAESAGPGGASSRSSGQRPMGSAAQRGQQSSLTALSTLLDQTADSLSGPVAGQIDSLRARIEEASGTEKRQLQTELVNLFIGAGHPGRAAVVQRDLAEATGSVDAQRRAADLLYRWMQKVQGQGQRQMVFQVAGHAAQAYEQVAEQRPDDLDARTRMGEAYLLTNEPMKGIKAINAVLDDDSTFVPARFQKGLALLQINRLDQATQQFEMVKQYAEDGSPFSQQAERALKVIEQQRAQASSGASSPAAGTNP